MTTAQPKQEQKEENHENGHKKWMIIRIGISNGKIELCDNFFRSGFTED